MFDCPDEIAISQAIPFRGFHLFAGEPSNGVVGFLLIKGIDALHALVERNGWTRISEVASRPKDAR